MPSIGLEGTPLNGPESRARRTVLNLERRHIALLVNILSPAAQGRCQLRDVKVWETSPVGAYPRALTEALSELDAAVDTLAEKLQRSAHRTPGALTVNVWEFSEDIASAIAAGLRCLPLDVAAQAELSVDNGDFWWRLWDAALTRMAIEATKRGDVLRLSKS